VRNRKGKKMRVRVQIQAMKDAVQWEPHCSIAVTQDYRITLYCSNGYYFIFFSFLHKYLNPHHHSKPFTANFSPKQSKKALF